METPMTVSTFGLMLRRAKPCTIALMIRPAPRPMLAPNKPFPGLSLALWKKGPTRNRWPVNPTAHHRNAPNGMSRKRKFQVLSFKFRVRQRTARLPTTPEQTCLAFLRSRFSLERSGAPPFNVGGRAHSPHCRLIIWTPQTACQGTRPAASTLAPAPASLPPSSPEILRPEHKR